MVQWLALEAKGDRARLPQLPKRRRKAPALSGWGYKAYFAKQNRFGLYSIDAGSSMALEGSKSNNTVVYSSKYHCVWTPKYRRSVLVGPIAKRCEPVIRPLKNIGLKSSPGKSCPTTCLCSLKWTRSSASTDWSRISREFPGTHCGKSFAHGNHGYPHLGRIAISYPRLAGQHWRS